MKKKRGCLKNKPPPCMGSTIYVNSNNLTELCCTRRIQVLRMQDTSVTHTGHKRYIIKVCM